MENEIESVQKENNPLSLLLYFLLFASFVFLTFPIWKSFIELWGSSDDHSHGFFILPICGYIIWQKKDELKNIEIVPSGWGAGVVILAIFLYVIGMYAEIVTVKLFSVIPMIAGSVLLLFGFRMTLALIFPLCFLIFMIPVPSQIYSSLTIPLQLFVSKTSVEISSLLGIPIFREGNVINLPENTLQVVQACSGLRSLTSLLTLSAVLGYLTLKSNILRCGLFLAAVPAAILVNIFRVFLTIIAFYYWDFDLTQGTLHSMFGLVVFVLALMILAVTKGLLSIWDK